MRTTFRIRLMALGFAIVLLNMTIPLALADANQTPDGFHDRVGAEFARRGECVAAGWAVDPDSPYERVTVRIVVDGDQVATEVADDFRQDLLDAEVSPDGFSSFYVFLGPLGIGFDVPHSVLIEAQDVQDPDSWTVLNSSPQPLFCTNLAGNHDGTTGDVSRSRCLAQGWAVDRDTDSERARVRVKVDGKVVAEATANQFRQDIADLFIGDGYSGFSVNLYGKMTPGVNHEVLVEMRDTSLKRIWLPLFNSPITLNCHASSHLAVAATYTSGSGPKAISVDARVTSAATGTWSFANLDGAGNPIIQRSGTISCLIIGDGWAWAAGPETWTNGVPSAGVFLLLRDGGTPGTANDLAVTGVAGPGESFAGDILPLCTNQVFGGWPLYGLDGGEVTISFTQ